MPMTLCFNGDGGIDLSERYVRHFLTHNHFQNYVTLQSSYNTPMTNHLNPNHATQQYIKNQNVYLPLHRQYCVCIDVSPAKNN